MEFITQNDRIRAINRAAKVVLGENANFRKKNNGFGFKFAVKVYHF